jgi:hypothetical protein
MRGCSANCRERACRPTQDSMTSSGHSNFPATCWVLIFSRRQAWHLLGEAVQNDQIHELSTSRGWIEIDLAKLCILKKNPQLARQHLRKAQLAAAAQESAIMLNEIDAIFASLR